MEEEFVSANDNKALARRFFEEFDRRSWDNIAKLLVPGEVSHLPGAPGPLEWPAHKEFAGAFVNAFPDCWHDIDDQVADDDNVVTRITFRGHHTGDLMGIPPTGREIAMGGMSWFKCSGGKIAEEWTHFDRLGLMIQLGVAPPPPAGDPLPLGKADEQENLQPLGDPMMVVRRWLERVDHGGVPDANAYVASEYLDHNPPPFPGMGSGITAVWQSFPYALSAFSDFHHEMDAQIRENDKVASRITGFGRHTGEFLGVPASGKDLIMSGISIHRVADGKLQEHWAQIDAMSMLQQMGAIPS
jgi:predicted ester cyclase